MKKYLLTAVLTAFCLISLQAQNNGVGFFAWLKEPMQALNQENTKSLLVKIDQIINRNGMGGTSGMSQVFVIYPQFVITRSDVVESGMKPIQVFRGELTLFAVNRADTSSYGSVMMELSGNGNSEQAAIRAMLNRMKISNPLFTRFMRNVQEKVAEYFTQNLPSLVTKANSLADRGEYEQALGVLAVVPESAAEYPDIARLMSEIYAKKMNRDGEQKALEGMSKKSIEAAARKEGMEQVNSNLEGTHRM